MAKFTSEEKIRAVNRYLEGKEGYGAIAEDIGRMIKSINNMIDLILIVKLNIERLIHDFTFIILVVVNNWDQCRERVIFN